MQFQIGPWEYRVAISADHLFDDEGNEVAGLCDWVHSLIQISGVIPRERRLDVLLHELAHAWKHHMGDPLGVEDAANNASSFSATCTKGLEQQGGDVALMAMEPESPSTPKIASGTSTMTWAQSSPGGGTECGCCGRRFSAGEIATEPPKFNPLTGKTVVQRGCYCDGCGYVQSWQEGVLMDMTPNGQIIGQLGQLRGADAVEWLRQHGEQAGVLVA